MTLRGVLLVGVAAMLWGTAGVASKAVFSIEPVEPLTVAFFRLVFCLPLLLLWSWRRMGAGLFTTALADRRALLLLAATAGGYQVFYFAAVAGAGVTLATLVSLGGAPFLVAGLAAIFLGERFTRATLFALLLAVPGVVLLVGLPGEAAGDGALGLGLLSAGAAALAYASFALASRRLAGGYAPAQLVIFGFGGAALLLVPVVAVLGLSLPQTWQAWGLLIYAGLIPTALAYLLFFAGMKQVRAATAGLLTLLEPLTAAALAWAIFDERLGSTGLLGAGLVLAGLALLSLLRR